MPATGFGRQPPEAAVDGRRMDRGGTQRVPARLRRSFRYANSFRVFGAISQYALERLAGFVVKRHKRSPAGACGW